MSTFIVWCSSILVLYKALQFCQCFQICHLGEVLADIRIHEEWDIRMCSVFAFMINDFQTTLNVPKVPSILRIVYLYLVSEGVDGDADADEVAPGTENLTIPGAESSVTSQVLVSFNFQIMCITKALL